MSQFDFGPKVDNQDIFNLDQHKYSDELWEFGSRLEVEIGWDRGCKKWFLNDPVLIEKYGSALSTSETVLACIDTGATFCALTDELASKLSLPIVQNGTAANVHGIEEACNYYVGYVHIQKLNFKKCFKMMGIKNTNTSDDDKTKFLIGRNVLQYLLFIYDGHNGCCKLSLNEEAH